MEKVDIFDQEVGRAAIECNGNLASTRAQAIPSVSWLEAFPAVKHCRNIK